MSEDKNIEEEPENYRSPTDNIEKSADDFSIASEESKTVAEGNKEH